MRKEAPFHVVRHCACRIWKTTKKLSRRIAGVAAEIRIKDLQNTKKEW
jgi:hypothetical protein